MSQAQGVIPGDSIRARCVALAGCLAELGVVELTVRRAGVWTPMVARVTDLPALIEQLVRDEGLAMVRVGGLGAMFEITAATGVWHAGEPQVAAMLRERLR